MGIIVVLQKLGFQLRYVHVRRALVFAAFARQTQVIYVLYFLMVEAVFLRRVRQHFAQNIGPRPRGVLFVAGSHVAGAHRSARCFGFSAVAGAVALLGVLEHVLVFIPEISLEFRRLLTRFVAQKRVHRGRVHNLAGVEDAVRVPGVLHLAHQFVVVLSHHLRNKLTP